MTLWVMSIGPAPCPNVQNCWPAMGSLVSLKLDPFARQIWVLVHAHLLTALLSAVEFPSLLPFVAFRFVYGLPILLNRQGPVALDPLSAFQWLAEYVPGRVPPRHVRYPVHFAILPRLLPYSSGYPGPVAMLQSHKPS